MMKKLPPLGRIAYGWWLLVPAIDLAGFVYVSPALRRPYSLDGFFQSAADLAASLFFWLSLFLLLSSLLALRPSVWLRVGKGLAGIGLAALFAYQFFLWSFIAGKGHLPNPETLVFLTENLSRIPQHLVQTSPLLVGLGVLAATTAALLTLRATTLLASSPGVLGGWRKMGAATLFLGAWYSISPQGSYYSVAWVAMNRDQDVALQARTNLDLQSLPARAGDVRGANPVTKRYPVVVLLVESLRYDLLTETPDAIPFLKQLHDENIAFQRAYAVASHSNLSDLAFWYSQYPLRGEGKEKYPVDAPWKGKSLFGAFKDAGYRTAYVSSQNERWGNMINWLKTPDVDYFFDSEDYDGETWENYDDVNGLAGLIKKGILNAGKIEDSETLRIARRWIDANKVGGPGFFLGMNLQNTHFSYVMPPGGTEPFQPSDMGFQAVYYSWPKAKKDDIRNRYLNSVVNVDRLIMQFVEFLKHRGLWDECLFVVLGDNGEGFYEHGFGNHSGPMYDEVVRTFSVMKLPVSLKLAPRVVRSPVSHIDIAATVPSVVGVAVPWSFQGLPLLPNEKDQRPVYMYSNAIVRQYGIVSWPWKMLVTEFPDFKEELFDVTADQAELDNLVEKHRGVAEQLRGSLAYWVVMQKKYYDSGAFLTRNPPLYRRAASPSHNDVATPLGLPKGGRPAGRSG